MELARQLWHETLRNVKLDNNLIVVHASISDIWKNRITPDLIKDIKKHGASLGYKVEFKQELFNWLIIKKK